MKYASEVIGLLAAFPGRRFRMGQILNHVVPRGTPRQRETAKAGVRRVLAALVAGGQVQCKLPSCSGSFGEYWWESGTSTCGKAVQKPAQFSPEHCAQ